MLCLGLSCLLLHVFVVFGTELTFELPDNDKQCFYEELEKDTKFEIDFQVSFSRPFHSVCLQGAAKRRYSACYLLFEWFVVYWSWTGRRSFTFKGFSSKYSCFYRGAHFVTQMTPSLIILPVV